MFNVVKNAEHLLVLLTKLWDVIYGNSLYAKLFVYL